MKSGLLVAVLMWCCGVFLLWDGSCRRATGPPGGPVARRHDAWGFPSLGRRGFVLRESVASALAIRVTPSASDDVVRLLWCSCVPLIVV